MHQSKSSNEHRSIEYKSCECSGNVRAISSGHIMIEKLSSKPQNKNRGRHSNRRRYFRSNRNVTPNFNRRVLAEGNILTDKSRGIGLLSKILKIFDNKTQRQWLIKELANVDGYECQFSEKDKNVSVEDDRLEVSDFLAKTPDFTIKPPVKWQDRSNKNESLFDFVKKEYAPWIGRNLLQAHIRSYDLPLYYALANLKSKRGINILKELGIHSGKELTEVFAGKAKVVEDPAIEAAFRMRERIRMRDRRSRKPSLSIKNEA